MRKLLIGAALVATVIVAIPALLIVSGTIDSSSLRMVLNVMTGLGGPQADATTVRSRYRTADGFSVSLYASDLPRARFLHITDAGDLLVSRPHAGDIVLLRRDANADGKPDAREVLIDSLQRPLGVDTHDGWLYIAESHRVIRLPFNSASGATHGEPEVVIDGLTDNGNHWSKTLGIGPDKRLYLAQGSTCNVCEEEDSRRATLMRFGLDGGDAEMVATGLRNSVGFDWAPWSGELYATDNGRDLLGDDFPPCELNLIREGGFYGWPYFNGDNVPDPDMGTEPKAAERTPIAPAHPFRAHNAPLGIRFLDAQALPADFSRSALVALHGSWNRSEPDGYKVVSLHFTADGIEERDFLWGFHKDGEISGRPVDVAQGPDGAIYISDDYAGAIYRVVYGMQDENGNLAVKAGKPAQVAPPAWTATADLASLASDGAALYSELGCRECHEQGENAKRLDHLTASEDYARVINSLQAPQSPMPVYPLSSEQQRALAVYVVKPGLRPNAARPATAE
ncbi:MAG: hypothetical protein Hals2KO_20370 [Halioglobus sp.]